MFLDENVCVLGVRKDSKVNDATLKMSTTAVVCIGQCPTSANWAFPPLIIAK